MKRAMIPMIALALLSCWSGQGQVNSGSTGRDGEFHPTTNIVVDMSDHPDGIYHYTSVYIPSNVTVRFTPNLSNTPVVWLVQSNVVIAGTIDVSGQPGLEFIGGLGGPGGWRGGNGGVGVTAGEGPGGGAAGVGGLYGGNGSYATAGQRDSSRAAAGAVYGNSYLVPLLGGSGGGGRSYGGGGGGGGGAILIAANGNIQIDGAIFAKGGDGYIYYGISRHDYGGGGSGGAIRLVATRISGGGGVATQGVYSEGGSGRIRFDAYQKAFWGSISGAFSQGAQFIVLPSAGQMPQLRIASIGGVAVSASPSGQLAIPDAVLSALQDNPVPVVVRCERIPLNTPITVTARPAMEATAVSVTGANTVGTIESSTATVLINLPRGGGWIYARAVLRN